MIGITGFTRGDNFGDSLMFAIYARYITSHGHDCCIIGAEEWFLDRIIELGIDVTVISENEIEGAVDKCIFIGGGYFGWPDMMAPLWQLRYVKNNPYKAVADSCIKSNIPYYLEGVEVGPGLFPLAQNVIKPILKNAASIVVRNIESAKYVRQLSGRDALVRYDVILGNLLQSGVSLSGVKHVGFTIGIHLTGSFIGDNIFASNFSRVVSSVLIKTKPDKVILFSDNVLTEEKMKATVKVQRALEKEGLAVELRDYSGIDEAINTINEMDMLITTKLHCGVVGLSLDKYVICMGSSPKLNRFYNFANIGSHYIHYFFSSKRKKYDFMVKHIERAKRGCAPLVSEKIKVDSKGYMSQLLKIIE